MPSPFDPLLDRVTDRLRVDDELRLEVAHELQTHLEESAAELRAAGRSDDDAVAEASRALGSEDELAEQLWQANRRRVRRRKVARWTLGATLVPAAAAIAIVTTWHTLLSVMLLVAMASHGTAPDSGLIGYAGRMAEARVLAKVPPADRALAVNDGDIDQRAVRARQILDRSPNDPAAFAQYASMEMARQEASPSPANLDALLDVLHKGAALDPDNALYPLAISAALFNASTTPDTRDVGSLTYTDSSGRMQTFTIPRYTVTNAKKFDDALAAFRSAAEKRYLDAYASESTWKQLSLLPADSLDAQLLRLSIACQTLLPHVHQSRQVFNQIGNVALTAAAKGDRTAAMDWISAEQRVAKLALERGDFLVELLTAAHLKLATTGQAALVHEKLGDHDAFEQAKARLAAQAALMHPAGHSAQSAARSPVKVQSLTDRYFLSAPTDVGRIDLAPHRSAEYALFDQASLTIGLFALLGVIVLHLLLVSFNALREKQTPTLIFINWRRLLKIILLSVILPAVAYLAYAWSPLSGRTYGAPSTIGALIVEYSLVGLIIFGLMRELFDRAMRDRSDELGLDSRDIPAPSTQWRAVAASLTLVGLAYLVIERWRLRIHDVDGRFSLAMAFGLGISACIWLFDLYTLLVAIRGPHLQPKFSWRLAFIPVAVTTVLTLAILILPALQHRERVAVRGFQKPVPYLVNEIENSQFHELRSKLLAS
jgi:hypothetical protein